MNNQDWTRLIPGCFGEADVIFGSHPLDRQRAQAMFIAAISAGATMADIVAEATRFMNEQGASEAHIHAQVQRIRNLGVA
jgi:hypothetical protein